MKPKHPKNGDVSASPLIIDKWGKGQGTYGPGLRRFAQAILYALDLLECLLIPLPGRCMQGDQPHIDSMHKQQRHQANNGYSQV